ncbi:hypothetical protein acsn021_19530 [Anaerocolumna cellulosilytica]|uniref:Uncharacterized protein n=1 Tax=Anaerocolumna cellulosilytica TaxID=433286 RepID=A0A6S6QUT1_9FIRM|nr:hypothetical protein [Anaerocolumna cellulosilytica]MBB5194654.1 hypothetical protein [Anaerocolumna cellulosilytica]BCJ94384.1 hypothetical protein acsn021_19530 [Anaerocolumna cellulosilytica]
MRGKKRNFLIGTIILFALLIVYLISYKYLIVPYQIKELNDNMVIDGIPYNIADEMENLDLGIIQEKSWEKNSRNNLYISYYNTDTGVIIFNGFPDLSDEYKFTLYRTKHDTLNVFGIRIGSNADNARKILKKWGYKKKDDDLYIKGRININFRCDANDKITELEVDLKSSDWFHKGYYK